METKIKKDWLDRVKSSEELHNDSIQWISEIHFINDEIRFLEHLLSANYIDYLNAGLYEKIEALVKQISYEKITGDTLLELINKQEKILLQLIESKSVTSNNNYLETHKKLDKEINSYIKNYKGLKKQIFEVVEKVRKKKEQKKLPRNNVAPKLLDK